MGAGGDSRKLCGHDYQTVFFSVGYCTASSMLSIINKFAVKVFPYPSSLTGLQYATSAAAVFLFGTLGFIDKVESCTWATVTTMTPVVLTFCGSVFCNMKVLQHANVETFIVLRSTTPLVVAVVDAIFRPYAAIFPSLKTWTSLILILAGACGYVYVDSEFSMDSYMWGAAYIFFFVVEMVWVKDIMTKVKISNWGLVFYNNFGSLFISLSMAILTDEGSAATWLFGLGAFHHTHDIVPVLTATGPGGHDVRHLRHHRRALAGDGPHWVGSRNTSAEAISAAADAAGQVGADRFVPIMGPRSTMVAAHDELRTRRKIVPYLAVSLSCLFGLGISFFGFAIRRRISATGFTVMGCTNKLLTLLVNSLVWTHHASLQAQVFVLISIAGGVLYSEFAKADADLKKQLAAGKASPPDKEKGLGALQHGAKEAGIPLSSKAGGAGGAERGVTMSPGGAEHHPPSGGRKDSLSSR